jgi:hypothetical protein
VKHKARLQHPGTFHLRQPSQLAIRSHYHHHRAQGPGLGAGLALAAAPTGSFLLPEEMLGQMGQHLKGVQEGRQGMSQAIAECRFSG